MKRNHTIREEDICRFSRHLHDLEYAPGSIEKYLRDLTAFQHWLAGRTVTQREIAAWKEYLHSLGCRSETVNTKLSALNRFFAFQGWSGLRARYYRIQRRFFRSTEREMTRPVAPGPLKMISILLSATCLPSVISFSLMTHSPPASTSTTVSRTVESTPLIWVISMVMEAPSSR